MLIQIATSVVIAVIAAHAAITVRKRTLERKVTLSNINSTLPAEDKSTEKEVSSLAFKYACNSIFKGETALIYIKAVKSVYDAVFDLVVKYYKCKVTVALCVLALVPFNLITVPPAAITLAWSILGTEVVYSVLWCNSSGRWASQPIAA